ncbi:MAG TPA: ribosomal protein S18-alanine N-acetyltransferase, partial [Candidatus Binataceae bacterium]|nr:ribosomal protein S18-alanine N-acetyltransferase [Candidatus Binataceae bacterium]
MRIRDANERDLPQIMQIERLGFAQPWSLDSFMRELSLPFSRIIVATAGTDGEIAGFLCRWLVADECHILNIAVHPGMRRHGIGARLMNDAIAEARKKQVQFMTLEVRRSNLAARGLYRKLRFEERRLRKNYYG